MRALATDAGAHFLPGCAPVACWQSQLPVEQAVHWQSDNASTLPARGVGARSARHARLKGRGDL
jgi:hypothetical protein